MNLLALTSALGGKRRRYGMDLDFERLTHTIRVYIPTDVHEFLKSYCNVVSPTEEQMRTDIPMLLKSRYTTPHTTQNRSSTFTK